MRVGRWQFSPGLWPCLAVLFFFPLLLSLGFWQLDRAEQKQDLYREFEQRQAAAPVSLNTTTEKRRSKEAMLWRNVSVEGVFRTDKQILLDNQVHGGEAGYYVFTALKLAGEPVSVLVNRGWVAAGADRTQVPVFATPTSVVTLSGAAKNPPATGIFLGDRKTERMSRSVQRAQQLDLEDIAGQFDHDLLPYIVRLSPESSHGFVREWQLPGSGEEKHLGYAFQWFALAATLLVIFVFVNLKKRSANHNE